MGGATEPSQSAFHTTAAFPRTAAYFLGQQALPAPEELARYDVVVIDNEWSHRVPRSFFVRVRALNPSIVLLAYVDLVDLPNQLGDASYWANRYTLWKFDGPTRNRFPSQWLARTAGGVVLSEFPGTVMANLTDRAPTVEGETYDEYAANWVVDTVWSSGIWNGIFLDVWGDRIYSATRNAWDIGGDGVDIPDSQIYGLGMPWGRGLKTAEQIMRSRMPTAILVANGDRTLLGQTLDGRVWENFADTTQDREPSFDLQNYVRVTSGQGHRSPGLSMTIDRRVSSGPVSAEDLRRARYFLTATLLQNGYWAGTGVDYESLADYDELNGAGLGRGFLGQPLVADPCPEQLDAPFAAGMGTVADRTYRRDFEHGLVLHNDGDVPRQIDLGRAYQRLRGVQDPVTNDGRVATTVTVPAHDGVILVDPAR